MTRGFLVFLTLAILVALFAAQAQPARKIPRIGVLEVGSPPSSPDWKQHSVFLQELRTLGWREGENLTIEYRWASGQFYVAPVTIGDRKAFSRAIITGEAVTEFEPNGKAAQEIMALWRWIKKQLGD